MFAGLVLTSISTVMLRAALFQRKSRSGWLEELDGIREDALDRPEGGVANVVDGDGIWTDLRDGGEYEDPHEISSLYATDATPDLPVTRPASRPVRRVKAAEAPAARPAPPAMDAPPPPPPPPPAPVHATVEAPAPVLPDPPRRSEPVAPRAPEPAAEVTDDAWPTAVGGAPAAAQYDDQIWVQPAPHPIRPSEMWHPAELAPAPLGEESFEAVAEERVTSAELEEHGVDPTYASVPVAPLDDAVHPPLDPRSVTELESELAAAADVAVAPAVPSSGSLVNGPVGRRVRRDRPAERPRASLPPAAATGTPAGAATPAPTEERSPLPTAPLPPAALPTRSNRLPGIDLPVTPSSVVSSGPTSAVTPRTISASAPTSAPAPTIDAGAPDLDPAAPAAQPPASADATVPAVREPAPAPIAIGSDGLIAAPGTIVRIGGERRARAAGDPSGVVVTLEQGWCWASPGDGAPAALRIELPAGSLTVEPGATALAVVEADGSIFLVVAAGSAHLQRGSDGATIGRGTIVMIDPSGAAQSDAASDVEIESDPIVAENLALDAEL